MNARRVLFTLAALSSFFGVAISVSENKGWHSSEGDENVVVNVVGDVTATATATVRSTEAASHARRETDDGVAPSDEKHHASSDERRRRRLAASPGAVYASYNDGWFTKFRSHDEVIARLTKICTTTPRHATNCRLTRIPNATSGGADGEAVLIGGDAHAGPVAATGGATIAGPWVG